MNAPTLLIGLGGTGCKIIERVSKMVTGEQRSNIAFAVFDTDINDLRGIQERNPFIKTIQTSTKQTVGEYLNKDTHARDTWFPVNAILNGKTLTEGAGQVRSISRLALETVIRAGTPARSDPEPLQGRGRQGRPGAACCHCQFSCGWYRLRPHSACRPLYAELSANAFPAERKHHPRVLHSSGGVL